MKHKRLAEKLADLLIVRMHRTERNAIRPTSIRYYCLSQCILDKGCKTCPLNVNGCDNVLKIMRDLA